MKKENNENLKSTNEDPFLILPINPFLDEKVTEENLRKENNEKYYNSIGIKNKFKYLDSNKVFNTMAFGSTKDNSLPKIITNSNCVSNSFNDPCRSVIEEDYDFLNKIKNIK